MTPIPEHLKDRPLDHIVFLNLMDAVNVAGDMWAIILCDSSRYKKVLDDGNSFKIHHIFCPKNYRNAGILMCSAWVCTNDIYFKTIEIVT